MHSVTFGWRGTNVALSENKSCFVPARHPEAPPDGSSVFITDAGIGVSTAAGETEGTPAAPFLLPRSQSVATLRRRLKSIAGLSSAIQRQYSIVVPASTLATPAKTVKNTASSTTRSNGLRRLPQPSKPQMLTVYSTPSLFASELDYRDRSSVPFLPSSCLPTLTAKRIELEARAPAIKKTSQIQGVRKPYARTDKAQTPDRRTEVCEEKQRPLSPQCSQDCAEFEAVEDADEKPASQASETKAMPQSVAGHDGMETSATQQL
ncbi:hypothetical protein cyc_05245 [Cyclospora cayetanensis]|uniref:Uncharacterized protein n=1 Tax=Cyclospora cayetanensis TaxID=88456 RepID=A0A1D3CR94_9EIME|nr:hypothetical protein cyc_05245 [Cyclospora cayetanensis]